MTGDLALVVMPDRVDAGAQALDADSTDALCLYLRVFGAHEGVDMPPDVRAKVTAAVDDAAAMLLRLSHTFNGLANYLRLRAEGARRFDTDGLADDFFVDVLDYGPAQRVLGIPEPVAIPHRDLAGLKAALKGVELKADLPGNGADGARTHIRQLERRLNATTDAAEHARISDELARTRRTLTAFEQWAKGARTYGVPAQILATAADIAEGENPGAAAAKAGLSGLLTRLAVRAAPGAAGGWPGIAAGMVVGIGAEIGIDKLASDEHEYASRDELLGQIEDMVERRREAVHLPGPDRHPATVDHPG
jgi:hypothetical protein